jgi:uncharacterized membrane protein YeaQ/YmgE (transglycosylase-associated protein family)
MLCGVVGQAIAGRSLGGCVVSTVVGLIGAVLGALIARSLGAPEPFSIVVGDKGIPLLWTIVGASLVTFIVSYMRRGVGERSLP